MTLSVPEEDALLPNQSNKYIASLWDKVWGRCAGSPQTPGFISCDRPTECTASL